MSQDPTAKGLPIQPTQFVMYRDVFDYVLQKYMAEFPCDTDNPTGMPAYESGIRSFIAKARELFQENQPVGTDNLSDVLALRFQDGTVLKFCDIPSGMDGVGGIAGGKDISIDHKPRGVDGKGRTVPQPQWSITGSPDKK